MRGESGSGSGNGSGNGISENRRGRESLLPFPLLSLLIFAFSLQEQTRVFLALPPSILRYLSSFPLNLVVTSIISVTSIPLLLFHYFHYFHYFYRCYYFLPLLPLLPSQLKQSFPERLYHLIIHSSIPSQEPDQFILRKTSHINPPPLIALEYLNLKYQPKPCQK